MDIPRPRALLRRVLTLAFVGSLAVSACGGTINTPTPGSLSPSPTSPAGCLPAPQGVNPDGWQSPSSAPPVIPQVISSDQVCGENRFLFGLLGSDNRSLAAPDRKVTVRFFDLGHDPTQPAATADGTFLWAIDDVVGVYDLNVIFTSTGVWGAEFTTTDASGANVSVRLTFVVVAHGSAVQVGERAPASESRTLADVGGDLAKISSDTDPVERFYTTSIADAVAAHKPFVLVFATPAFCTSAQCGPTLDRLKPVAAAHPDVTVINVEPYELTFEDGQLQPVRDAQGYLVPVAATLEWGLPSEPWIYVVDGDGMVRASFEGIVSAAELEAAVSAVE
ncbi:MAG TPA: hypothetical protein VFC71_10700 [Candidatus Polarisedimenticolia bacterium]|nr:hypothetical protein [Candidatus Polarisedimenticolia bacterium]